jgi:hypothetical protein
MTAASFQYCLSYLNHDESTFRLRDAAQRVQVRGSEDARTLRLQRRKPTPFSTETAFKTEETQCLSSIVGPYATIPSIRRCRGPTYTKH